MKCVMLRHAVRKLAKWPCSVCECRRVCCFQAQSLFTWHCKRPSSDFVTSGEAHSQKQYRRQATLVKFSERQTNPPQNSTSLHASSLKQILLPIAPISRFVMPSTVAP